MVCMYACIYECACIFFDILETDTFIGTCTCGILILYLILVHLLFLLLFFYYTYVCIRVCIPIYIHMYGPFHSIRMSYLRLKIYC